MTLQATTVSLLSLVFGFGQWWDQVTDLERDLWTGSLSVPLPCALSLYKDKPPVISGEFVQTKDIGKLDQKLIVNGVNAAPTSQTQEGENDKNIFALIMSLLCGALCKDTMSEQNAPVGSLFSELKFEGFSKDICRSMVAMLDSDRSGKLGYQEFKDLWTSILQWKNVWAMYDIDKSGTFSGFELREALNSAGFRLNNKVLNVLMHRYGSKGQINFDDFMMCSVKLKTMIDVFKGKDSSGTNAVTFSMDEWLEKTLYT